ncbi:MAG: hypothetical protein H8D70_01540 [Rhodospirillaceae bacterium]|nr:hypothetical protein [Rhodospirillaceae bacterium]
MFLDVLLLLFWGFMALIFLLGLLYDDPDIEARTSYLGVFFMAAVVVGGFYYLIRILKVRGPLLKITPVGFIYALHGTEMVLWQNVATVEVERGTRWTHSSYVYIALKDGSVVEIECEFFTLDVDQVVAAISRHGDVSFGKEPTENA